MPRLANIEASELLSDSRWVCLMLLGAASTGDLRNRFLLRPSKGNNPNSKPGGKSPSPVPMEIRLNSKERSNRMKLVA